MPVPVMAAGMNEDDFNDMYGTKFLGPDDVKPTRTVIDTVGKGDLRPP